MPEYMATPARSQPKRHRVLACQACRSRRTRCDGRKPSCGTCEGRGYVCQYPVENKRPAASIEDELANIRSQLERIESVVTTAAPAATRGPSTGAQARNVAASPWACAGSSSSVISNSPGTMVREFPYMKLQTSAFTQLAGLGEDYGNRIVRLEQTAPPATTPAKAVFVLQHGKVMASLQSFSAKIHPWYPILEDRFSDCISSFLANSLEPGADAFLVLMVLASGAIAEEPTHSAALEDRPDAMYLNVALEMLHLVVLEQSLRSLQCLVAASIHYYLLLKPMQAHDLVVLAIKKAQNLHLSGALRDNHLALEHWIRVYRVALLIEAELIVPLRLADSMAWDSEEEVALPTGIDIWSLKSESAARRHEPTGPSSTISNDNVITYLLAEIAMRRMLRRNTTAMTVSADGSAEYAPLVAQELEAQLEQWWSFLPEPLRFSPEYEDGDGDVSLQVPFLRAQYWACMVSLYWPAVVQVMESHQLTETTVNGCRSYFYSYREFTKSATAALKTCLPNKWTLYASIFAISVAAYLGASNELLSSLASPETWDMLRLARRSFGDECRRSPSLAAMAEGMRLTLSSLREA